jgi:hypothetical protein
VVQKDFDLSNRIPMFCETLADYGDWEQPRVVVPLEEANVIASMTPDGTHRPVIDLDVPARLYPSSTPSHSHLYIDVDLTHEQYEKLIGVLVEVGIVQKGIQMSLERRGATFVRPPWVKKPKKEK